VGRGRKQARRTGSAGAPPGVALVVRLRMAGREIMVIFAVGWALAVRGFVSWHGAPGSCRARERRDLTRTDEAIPYLGTLMI
jgi:hypothetical protein